MEQGDDTLKTIINSTDFKAKLLTAAGQKKLKKSKDPNIPKKPTTTWLLFCNDTRPKLKQQDPSLKMSEITSLMSPMWADLQKSKNPDDVATVDGYNKIVEAQRTVFKAAKDKVVANKPKKTPKNAWQLFMKYERAKPKPEGETFGTTTTRISAAWARLKEDDPQKIAELTAEVKSMRAEADESSASECENASDTEAASATEAASDTEATEEQTMSIEAILQKMHEEDDMPTSAERQRICPGLKEDNTTSNQADKVTNIEDGTSTTVEEKPKPKPKARTEAKVDDDAPKQKRPRCKKKAAAPST